MFPDACAAPIRTVLAAARARVADRRRASPTPPAAHPRRQSTAARRAAALEARALLRTGARAVAPLAALALFAAAADVANAALYRWVDEKGRVQYSDTPPHADKGAVQLSNRGIVLKKPDAAVTPEQQKAKDAEEARRKAEEAKAAEQRRLDSALLQSFTTVEEIDMKRDREIQALEISLANLREQDRAVAARLADDRRRVEAFAKAKKPPSEALKEDVLRGEAERKVLEDEMKRRREEIAATRVKYEALKQRYVGLRREATMIQPASADPPAAAKR